MRDEKTMMNLILDTAKADARILAAYLKGSRTNPRVPKDIYRDFDVMFVVTETESFRTDMSWVAPWGRIILMQEQDSFFGYGDRFGLRSGFQELYSWLLLFEDGNRIDIGVETTEHMRKGCTRNRLFLPLLDKVGCLPDMPLPSDEDFHIKKPSEAMFRGCCNEFFWSLCDVTKGLARGELPFVMTTYHSLSRPMLEQMLCWHIGFRTGFASSSGKLNRFFKDCLPEALYRRYCRIYSDASFEHIRSAVHEACALFHNAAINVARQLHVAYPQQDEDGFLLYARIIEDTLQGCGDRETHLKNSPDA